MIYWFTGQPGHGKTTLASHLKSYLEKHNDKVVHHIDGDDLRSLTLNKDYSKEGREKNMHLAQGMALRLAEEGCIVVVSLLSPFRNLREEFKVKTGCNEIYVFTIQLRGKEAFHVDYEKPEKDFLFVDTTNVSVEESLSQIINHFNLN